MFVRVETHYTRRQGQLLSESARNVLPSEVSEVSHVSHKQLTSHQSPHPDQGLEGKPRHSIDDFEHVFECDRVSVSNPSGIVAGCCQNQIIQIVRTQKDDMRIICVARKARGHIGRTGKHAAWSCVVGVWKTRQNMESGLITTLVVPLSDNDSEKSQGRCRSVLHCSRPADQERMEGQP